MQLPHAPLHPLELPWALTLLPLGFGLGCAYFAALRRSVDRLLDGRPGALGLLLRMAAVILLLAAGAHWGSAALLALFGGFLLARALALRPARRTRPAPEGR